jgi:hypothetical protein
MASSVRRLKRFVQEIANAGGVNVSDATLAAQIVHSIARNGNCHLSDVARTLDESKPLIETERRLSEGCSSFSAELIKGFARSARSFAGALGQGHRAKSWIISIT